MPVCGPYHTEGICLKERVCTGPPSFNWCITFLYSNTVKKQWKRQQRAWNQWQKSVVSHLDTVILLTLEQPFPVQSSTKADTAGFSTSDAHTKKQFDSELQGLQQIRDHRWKALGNKNLHLTGRHPFFCPGIRSTWFLENQVNPFLGPCTSN